MFKLRLNSKNNPPTKKMDLFKAAVSKVASNRVNRKWSYGYFDHDDDDILRHIFLFTISREEL